MPGLRSIQREVDEFRFPVWSEAVSYPINSVVLFSGQSTTGNLYIAKGVPPIGRTPDSDDAWFNFTYDSDTLIENIRDIFTENQATFITANAAFITSYLRNFDSDFDSDVAAIRQYVVDRTTAIQTSFDTAVTALRTAINLNYDSDRNYFLMRESDHNHSTDSDHRVFIARVNADIAGMQSTIAAARLDIDSDSRRVQQVVNDFGSHVVAIDARLRKHDSDHDSDIRQYRAAFAQILDSYELTRLNTRLNQLDSDIKNFKRQANLQTIAIANNKSIINLHTTQIATLQTQFANTGLTVTNYELKKDHDSDYQAIQDYTNEQLANILSELVSVGSRIGILERNQDSDIKNTSSIDINRIAQDFDYGVIGAVYTNPLVFLLQKVDTDFGTFLNPADYTVDIGSI